VFRPNKLMFGRSVLSSGRNMGPLRASLIVLRLCGVALPLSLFRFGPSVTTLGRNMTVLRPKQVVLGRSVPVLARTVCLFGRIIHRLGS
jgi:hypothetical protein